MTYSRLKIAQMACGELPCTIITALNENSVAARQCGLFFDVSLAEAIQQIKPRFARRRAILAALVNDRDGEWSYAYAEPDDMAYIEAVRPSSSDAVGYELLVGQTRPGYQNHYGMRAPDIRYESTGSIIYTDEPNAVLEFFRSDIDLSKVTPNLAKAISLTLATRICLPVIKDKVRRRELVTETEVWVQRAIADERNQEQQSYDHVPENAIVRQGFTG